jgi:hypothetical protein
MGNKMQIFSSFPFLKKVEMEQYCMVEYEYEFEYQYSVIIFFPVGSVDDNITV